MVKRTYEGTLSLTVGNHTLYGSMQKGKWTFKCRDFPIIEHLYDGAQWPDGAVDEFMIAVIREAGNEQ